MDLMRLPWGVRDGDGSTDGWSVSSETKADTSDSDKVEQQRNSSLSSLLPAIDSGERGLFPLCIYPMISNYDYSMLYLKVKDRFEYKPKLQQICLFSASMLYIDAHACICWPI